MTMTMKISLFDINHLNTMIRENKAENNNVVNEQETIQNNIKCRYRRPCHNRCMSLHSGAMTIKR